MSEMPRREFLRKLGGGVAAIVLGGAALAPDNRRPPSPVCDPLPSSERVQGNSPYFVYLPGFAGGGENVTALRAFFENQYGEKAVVFSNFSTPFGLKKGEDIDSQTTKNAQTAGSEAGDNDIHVVAHSSSDATEFFDKLLDCSQWKGKNIKLHILSPIGFGREGLDAVVTIARRAFELSRDVAVLGQHWINPLPEAYYQAVPPKDAPVGVQTIYRYTPEEREKFKETFRQWKEMIMPDEKERNLFTNKVNELDAQIADALGDTKRLNALVLERAEVIKPYIEMLFRGKQYPPEQHEYFRAKNKELPQDIADPLWYKAMFALYIARSGFNYYQGIDKRLGTILAKAKERGVDTTFDFVMQEKDEMVKMEEIPLLQTGVIKEGNVTEFRGIQYIQGFSHSGVGVYPEKVLEAILKPAA